MSKNGPLKILVLDTTATLCMVALLQDPRKPSERITAPSNIQVLTQEQPAQHAQFILPMIQTLLQMTSLSLAQLDAIAYNHGPGSFTGTRIGSSVVQAISFVHDLPVLPLSSLAILAQSAYLEKQWRSLFVCQETSPEKLYWAFYQANPQGFVELIGKESLTQLDNIRERYRQFNQPLSIQSPSLSRLIEQTTWQGISNRVNELRHPLLSSQLNLTLPVISPIMPSPYALAQLAALQFAQQNWVNAAAALPIYGMN